MKLTLFLCLFVVAQSFAIEGYSQRTKLDLSLTNVSVKEALRNIEDASNFFFLYNDDLIDVTRKVNIDVQGENIEDILELIFKGTGVSYTVKDRQIVLTPDQSELVENQQQTTKLSGVVTDTSGGPLPGVTVVVKGTSNGVVTDMDGKYNLADVPADAVLVFSFVGMKTQEIALNGKSEIDVTLAEESIGLDEVVAVGYGVQKKATLSGSITNVKGDDLIKTPVTNVSQSVAGRMPGVVAISNGGEPGYDGATLRIRGVNTFGNSAPLIVVDGVPGRSLDRIDPSTIESMSVMKDASAAIYGAQAANGVILITTKRGTVGKPTVKVSFNQGFSKPTVLPEMANAAEYATLLNEIDQYDNRPNRYTDDQIQQYRDGSDPWRYPNTDWFHETLKPWSNQNYGNVSIDGGTENMKYFVSISQKSQDGFYRHSATKYNQYDMKSNLDLKINKYLDLYINTTGRMEDRNFPTRSGENIFRMLMRSKPNSPAYWPNGLPGPDIEYGDNPVVIVTDATGYNHDKRYILNSDFGLNLKVPGVEGLTFKANASLDKTFRFQKQWSTPWYLYSWPNQEVDENGEPILVEGKKGFDDPRLSESMEDNQGILVSGLLNYTRTFDDIHTVNLLAGVERITNKGDSFSAFRRYFLSSAIDQLFAGGQDEINNDGTGYEQARLNYFGRVNYSFKDKYLAEFVWRYQGSYIFEESSRFGFFPGVSLGYVMSEENFFKENVPFINFLKIRASWGQTGNDLIDPYQYLASYRFNNLMFISNGGNSQSQALYEGVIPNDGVTWESATQQNVGFDLHILNGDIAITADYFLNKRDDILWQRNASIPNTAGLTLPRENIGKVKNQGVDFSIDYRKRFNDFTLGVGINGVYSKNKILFWDETAGAPDYQQSTGRPIDSDLYYNAIGIFQTQEEIDAYPHWNGARPGDVIFEDYNGDEVLDAKDRVRYDKSRTPVYTGGLNVDMGYKNFDLSLLFQGAFGGIFYETTESGDFGNYLKSFYDSRWTEENPSTTDPRTYNRSDEYWVNQRNTYWVHKSNYVRLKSIELGYTIPKSLTQRFLVNDLRMYVSAFNLFTISPDMDDYDPENTSGSGYNYPLNKVINVGLSVTF
ncbi:TonB-dependent receptor [Mangrovibacterium lignilyticum]|uniref:TonB-dependent receptor n=1 Tax=Mangrovibacterium lignilyticum TaxID=2668052 RepID=UPI001967F846|nr:TonB-dependent receptor [Mangrovibacterium lignilyticum]